jgi:DNA-binding transcriptional ArsR family regulator
MPGSGGRLTDLPSLTTLRAAARIANGFALDLVRLGGFGRDVIDGLLLAAVGAANVSQITRDPALQLAYATLDQEPPDELRRPVSINALATSLRLPFETVRRRIKKFEELGIVHTTPKGVIIAAVSSNAPFYRIAFTAHYQMVRTLYGRFWRLGLLRDLPHRECAIFDPENPPIRLVTRLSRDYVLRLIDPLTEHIGDVLTGIILMDVIHANTEHLPDIEAGTDQEGPEGFLPDDQRRPVRAAAISQRLKVSHETVRRHLKSLVEDGRCVVVGNAYVVPAEVLSRGPFLRYMLDNQTHMQRLFQGLAEAGVTAAWDAEETQLRLTA